MGWCDHAGQMALCELLWDPWKKGFLDPLPGGRSSFVCDAAGEFLCLRLENAAVLRKSCRTLGLREPAEVLPPCPLWPRTWAQV